MKRRQICAGLIFVSAIVSGKTSEAQAADASAYTGTTNAASTNIPAAASPDHTPATTNSAASAAPPPDTTSHVATLEPSDLKEFADLSPAIQALIVRGLDLTRMNLKYQYGSCDPKSGGMDCSGTVYYLLNQAGLKDVPRDSTGLYTWVWNNGGVVPVVSSSLKTFELDKLKPGDLLFWVGTYDVQRDPPISHVMIYLGTERQDGRRVMVGASEGRQYGGKSRYGVSVFDFVLPGASRKGDSGAAAARESSSRFIGYGPIPGLQ